MLQKQFRLPPDATFSHAVSITTPYFTMKIVNNSLLYNRFGFVVSKRIDKRATKRNSVKRKLRACIEDVQGKITSGYDLLFIIRKQALETSYQELYHAVEQVLSKQKILNAL